MKIGGGTLSVATGMTSIILGLLMNFTLYYVANCPNQPSPPPREEEEAVRRPPPPPQPEVLPLNEPLPQDQVPPPLIPRRGFFGGIVDRPFRDIPTEDLMARHVYLNVNRDISPAELRELHDIGSELRNRD
jgi:hypothetical protein